MSDGTPDQVVEDRPADWADWADREVVYLDELPEPERAAVEAELAALAARHPNPEDAGPTTPEADGAAG